MDTNFNHHSLFNRELILSSLKGSFYMLLPQYQLRNPVILVTYVSAIFTTIVTIQQFSSFNFQISLWLWFTLLFANFASMYAESRGKAQAVNLRKTQVETLVKKIIQEKEVMVPAITLVKGDVILCEVGDTIPLDGEVIEGIATVDESAITGESAPVIRESGGDRSAVTSGTRVISDHIFIRITSNKGESFLDKMIQLIEGAQRQKTPNEIALHIVLAALTAIFLFTVISLKFFAEYSAMQSHQNLSEIMTIPTLSALLVCLIPTTISALLSAIGISGLDRLLQKNVVAKSGRSVEAAGDINLLILDKTGTITLGNRMATEFVAAHGIKEKRFAEIAQLASLADETPEGRSIVVLAKKKYNLRAETLDIDKFRAIPFSAQTKMSGIDFIDKKGNTLRMIRKGSVDSIKKHIEKLNGVFPANLQKTIYSISKKGETPLLVADGNEIVGLIRLKDILKGGIKERFIEMRKIGIKTLMITGDNALTAGAIAAEAGVDDYVPEATPQIKLDRIRQEQKNGHLVAMIGDGTNDAPALAQADVGVAMNTGTQASREAGNMVDLDSNPTKLLDIVEIGKQLLMTRGSITTFSLANDLAKYFAIIPAIFGSLYAIEGYPGPLQKLNVMSLHSPQSAILSAVIFNALIIIALIPISLKGVRYKADTADKILQRNLLIYGLGGIISPFIGIKLIDLFITRIGLI